MSLSDVTRVDCWKLRSKTLAAGRIPLLMGIVNVTPDSFSDGGRFFEPGAAVEQGLRLADQGAADGTILAYSDGPLVSVDFNHTSTTSNFDATLTRVRDDISEGRTKPLDEIINDS